MKVLFYWLLNRYSKTEKDRIIILQILNEKVQETYHEQTSYGNFYHFFTEFIVSNDLVKQKVKHKNTYGINIIKEGLMKAYDKALELIEKENK